METPSGSDSAPRGEYLRASSSTSCSTSGLSSSSRSSSSFSSGDSSSTIRNSEPTSLTFQVLKEITDNFSKERVVGQGAYGKVYKGTFKNGEEIAVKMLYNNVQAVDDENFVHEFDNLMMLNHKNIIRLVSYCYETRRQHTEVEGKRVFGERTYKALCFEYMHMGSLQRHLSDETTGLNWQTRYRIIKDTCEGLKYLHVGLQEPIYHLDLKPDNILLDKNMIPKLADFGLSKLFGEEQTRVTQSSIGTIGYLPPEYLFGNVISNKLDIFSLGVIITKIIAGPSGHTRRAEMSCQEFLDQVNKNWRHRLEATCTSETLEANCEQLSICTDIGLRCMDMDKHKRPSIVDIIHVLDVTETMIEKGTTLRRVLSNITLDHNRPFRVAASSFSTSSKIFSDTIKKNEKLDILPHQEALNRLFCRQTFDNVLNTVDYCQDYKLLEAKESPLRSGDISDTIRESIITMCDHEIEKYDPKLWDNERLDMVEKLRKEMCWRKEVRHAWQMSHETVEELVKKLEETTKEKHNEETEEEMTRQIEKQVKEESEHTRKILMKEQQHAEKDYAKKEEQLGKTRNSGKVQYMMEGEWT